MIFRFLAVISFFFAPVLAHAEPAEKIPALDLHCEERVEMGTPFKICLYASAAQALNVKTDIRLAFDEIKKMDAWMSEWREKTELSQVNESAGARPIKITKDLFELIAYSLEVAKETDGAFDPTFNAFWGLYNFKKGHEREPTEEEIAERLPLINYKNVILDNKAQTVFLKKAGMKLGLGGLGQGYAVDRIVERLKTQGYGAGYVDGSGDTYFWGKKPNGELWITGVRDPSNHDRVVARIYGTDFAITTSGDDEKYFIKNGRRIHHIIDTKTGRPANRSRQVTVISPKALEADAYDTACFVLGVQRSIPLLKKKKMEAVLISQDGKITLTSGMNLKKTKWGDVYEVSFSDR